MVQKLRTIREQVSKEIQNMTAADLKKYLESKSDIHPASVWKKYKMKPAAVNVAKEAPAVYAEKKLKKKK